MLKKRPIVKGKKLEELREQLRQVGAEQYDRIKKALDRLDHQSPLVVDLHNVLGEAWDAFVSVSGIDAANRSGGGEK